MAEQVHSQQTGRSEVDLVADVCARLLEEGIVRRDALGVAGIARALDISAAEIKQAWVRYAAVGWRRPRRLSTTLAVVPAASNRIAAPRRPWKQEPESATCRVCDEEQPIDQFALASGGRRKRVCVTCESARARKRYLTVELQAELGAILRFKAGNDDACIGEECPHCSGQIQPGEMVVARTRGYEHSRCLSDHGRGPLKHRPGDVGLREHPSHNGRGKKAEDAPHTDGSGS